MTKNKPAGESSPRYDQISPASPTTPAARPGGIASKVQLRAASPEAVLAVVPHMLGFYPSKSLVVLGLGEQNRVLVTFRYDVPEPPDDQLAQDIAEHARYVLNRERIWSALVVGYGPEDLVWPVLGNTAVHLSNGGIHLQEVLRAEGGRYWSMLCDEPACCPPEGRSYDPGSHPAAAAMADAGLAAQPDREALARTLQRPAGSADVISRATGRALDRLSDLVELGEAEGDRDPQLRATRTGRREVQRAIRRYRSGGSIDSIEHLAWLAVLLSDIRVRDDAWARMHPAFRDHHCRLWTDVLRSAALDYVPAPASLLAFTAWQTGNGALAAMAIDRALNANPSYSMAQLLAEVIEAALPPSAARMPMTPAAVAASYVSDPVAAAAVEASGVLSDGGGSGSAKFGAARTGGQKAGSGKAGSGGAGSGKAGSGTAVSGRQRSHSGSGRAGRTAPHGGTKRSRARRRAETC
ncbi:MAG TPA: DUF4192 domain-containing protein [Streptosporangiaceae bacterium]|nr:DUF4192 domain-containing protein [Streptosporangiaceae bacterium]